MPPSLQILVVEDEPLNQLVILALLGRLGHDATIAENGQLALDILGTRTFDLVLMDVMMPVMDGLATVYAIRRKDTRCSQGSRLPIIMVTAHDSPDDMVRVMDAGPDGFLAKPVELESLRQEISRVLGH